MINNATMIDCSQQALTGQPVLMLLRNAGAPESALDAGARYPPPRCHPETRKMVQSRLYNWLIHDNLQSHNVTWLFGPAGVGKSAVAQTFAEAAERVDFLAAAVFLSNTREAKRSDPLRIVPTIAYQLAMHSRYYLRLVTERIAGNPSVLDATLQVQFRKLLVEPFLQLAAHNIQPFGEDHHLVVIDGLDECNDEASQCELIELIKEAAQKPEIPLVWLISSRPEPHISYTFSQLEYASTCGREKLVINDEARSDVERYLRERFRRIHERYHRIIVTDLCSPWPNQVVFAEILKEVAGHFVVASTAERFVGDPAVGDPEAQLASLLNLLRGLSNFGEKNPLATVDALYSRILAKVSESILPITSRVLSLCSYDLDRISPDRYARSFTLTRFSLFLRTNQTKLYNAMQRLHSVMNIPDSEDSTIVGITFHHKSFKDYLTSPRRSGSFFISRDMARSCWVTNSLSWHQVVLHYNNPKSVGHDEHSCATSRLTAWFSSDAYGPDTSLDRFESQLIHNYKSTSLVPGEISFYDDIADVLENFSFDLCEDESPDCSILPIIAIDLTRHPRFSRGFARAGEKESLVDTQLLENLRLLTNEEPVESLELAGMHAFANLGAKSIRYVIIGQYLKSGLACIFKGDALGLQWEVIWLNTERPPTDKQRYTWRRWRGLEIDDDRDKAEPLNDTFLLF
ncbi:hypothetical protein NP233_g12517 [Leucocoprinus birnbaumii]|uniref:NACHT domain-containing protein n=1 Tax=Leucocoprinus birnbaumii TaxID=56174 RepID=A0AAD5VEG9_9AGAR|nr:hypothetical protein NP233_g12517 [Leucocoprinus birnbaumii]